MKKLISILLWIVLLASCASSKKEDIGSLAKTSWSSIDYSVVIPQKTILKFIDKEKCNFILSGGGHADFTSLYTYEIVKDRVYLTKIVTSNNNDPLTYVGEINGNIITLAGFEKDIYVHTIMLSRVK